MGDSFGRLVPAYAEAGSEGKATDGGHEVAAALEALASADADTGRSDAVSDEGPVADERTVAIEALRERGPAARP